MEEMRNRRKIMRDAISRGESLPIMMPAESNSFKAAPLREWAKAARVDENDPLLLRALEAQAKAEYGTTNWESWFDMEDAIQEFIEAHFDIKDAWPPNAQQIEAFLQKVEKGRLTAVEVEEFQRIADETFRDWQPEYSPAFKERIKSALSLLEK